MNTTVKHTVRMTWVAYISQQLSRAENLAKYPGFMLDEKREQRSYDVAQMLREYVKKHAPSGSGIDNGIALLENSSSNKLMFSADFHHMNGHGVYDGWTEHEVVVKPCFIGIDIRVSGRDRNQIKDHIHQTFHHWLTSEAEHPALVERD